MKTVAITIVNWNGKEMLQTCLRSIAKQTYTAIEVIIVDNGSTDGSVEYIQAHYPEMTLITLDHNTGFASPQNLAITHALKNSAVSYILTLNNDTELDSRFVEQMVAAAEEQDGSIGAIQGKIVNFNDSSLIDCTGILTWWDMSALNRGQGEKDVGQYDVPEEVFGASASAALYTRSALETMRFSNGDFFDSDYFAYYEDVDLAWRLRLAGFHSFYTPDAVAKHIHSATGKSHSPFKAFYIHRNHFYNIIKNMPLWICLAILLLTPIRYLLLFSSLIRKKGAAAELQKIIRADQNEHLVIIVMRSWWDVLRHLPTLAKKRRLIQSRRIVGYRTIYHWVRQFHASWKKIFFGEGSDTV